MTLEAVPEVAAVSTGQMGLRMLREDVKDDAAAAGDPAQLEEVR